MDFMNCWIIFRECCIDLGILFLHILEIQERWASWEILLPASFLVHLGWLFLWLGSEVVRGLALGTAQVPHYMLGWAPVISWLLQRFWSISRPQPRVLSRECSAKIPPPWVFNQESSARISQLVMQRQIRMQNRFAQCALNARPRADILRVHMMPDPRLSQWKTLSVG